MMKQFKWTISGLFIAVTLLVVTLIFELDLFESFNQVMIRFDEYEIDEFIFPSLIVFLFSFLDLLKYKKKQKIQEEKEHIYKAMVQASDHVLKNCLNQMLLVKYTAEETPGFDRSVLVHFDTALQEATDQIENLGSISDVDRDKIGASIDLKLFD